MPENVVYILGAGFSAPLGLPVMSNFLIYSKDLYFRNRTEYSHFADVFSAINEMSVVKNYYSADLFNIEEILSTLEMRSYVAGERFKESFTQYIVDVIQAYTPNVEPNPGYLPTNWHQFAFGKGLMGGFGYFVAHLLGVTLQLGPQPSRTGLTCTRTEKASARYGIVSLNYDLVLENLAEYLDSSQPPEFRIGFRKNGDEPGLDGMPILAKLHGSVDTGAIVPPTWSKGTHPEIVPAWREALRILSDANHVRIIGYSLPTSDAYVRYLLKSAASIAPHMKSIDVICMDPTGSVRVRYDEFVEFNNYRFRNASTTEYLEALVKEMGLGVSMKADWCDKLEKAHHQFMSQT